MEKRIKFIKEIIVFVITVVFLLVFNRRIAVSYENFLEQNYEAIILCGLKLIFITEMIRLIYDVICIVTFKMSHMLWMSALNNLKVGIEQNFSGCDESLNGEYEDILISQCFGLFMAHADDCLPSELIYEMKRRFEDETVPITDKEEIAYIILSNKANKNISEFCSTPQGSEFFLSCERISQTVIRRSTFTCERISFDSAEFRSITNEFLHIGLAYGTINTDERIDYIRKVLSWVRQELKNKSSIDNQCFQKFILALSKIENNLIYHNLRDELIETYIKQIKKSWSFKRMYWNANKRLWLKKYHIALKDRVYDVGFVIAYSSKFGIFYRVVLHNVIKTKMKEYRRVYHQKYRDAISILILAVPLGNMESPENNYADKLLTVLDIFGGKE